MRRVDQKLTRTRFAYESRSGRVKQPAGLYSHVTELVLDSIGRAIQPDLYTPVWGYVADGRVWQFLSGALFVNQIWFNNVPQGSMLPYWSLGFEVGTTSSSGWRCSRRHAGA